jgi:hypothetical protein
MFIKTDLIILQMMLSVSNAAYGMAYGLGPFSYEQPVDEIKMIDTVCRSKKRC